MSNSKPRSSSLLMRVVPSLLACALMSAPAFAAVGDPTFSVVPASGIVGSFGNTAAPDITIDWGTNISGFDPLSQTDLKVVIKTTATPNFASDTLTTLTTANILTSTASKTVLRLSGVAAGKSVYIQTLASAAYDMQANAVSPTASNLYSATGAAVYTNIAAASVMTAPLIKSPADKSVTTLRTPQIAVEVNIDDDAAGTPAAINASFGTTDAFKVNVTDDVSGLVVGTANVYKKGWVSGATTANKQTVTVNLTTPLTTGAHVLTAQVVDPIGVNCTGTAPTCNLLIWDAPTLKLDDLVMATGSTVVFDRTQNLTFTGTQWAIDATNFKSAVTMKIDTVTISPTSTGDPTKFKFVVPTLASSATHTVELTQSLAGTTALTTFNTTPAPFLLQSYTINNSTITTATPEAPSVSSPSGGMISSLTPTIVGQAEPYSTLTLTFTDTTSLASTTVTGASVCTADSAGKFTFSAANWNSATLVRAHAYTISLTATNKQGLTGPASPDLAISVPASAATVNLAITPTSTTGGTGITTYTDPVTSAVTKYTRATGAVSFTVTATDASAAAIASATFGTPNSFATTDVVVSPAATVATTATGTAATTGTFVFTVAPTTQGSFDVSIPEAALTVGGNNNIAAPTYTFVRDTVAPTVSAQIVPKGPSTGSIGTAFDIVLTSNEPFDDSSLSGIGSGITYTRVLPATPTSSPALAGNALNGRGSPTISADKKTITIPYSGVSWTNTGVTSTSVTLVIPNSAVTDQAGNAPTSVTGSLGKLIEPTGSTPTCVISVAATILPVGKISPMPFTFTFNKAVANFSLADLDIVNGVPASTGLVAGATGVYTLNVIPGEGPTAVRVGFKSGSTISDSVSATTYDLNSTATVSRTYDSTPPRILSLSSTTAAPTSTDTKPTNRTSIPCSLVFNEAVYNPGATLTNLTAATVGTYFTVDGGTISGFTGSGTNYSFNVDVGSPANVLKTVKVVFQAGKVQDAVGNLNSAAAVLVRNYDGIPPSVAIDAGTLAGTPGTATTYTSTVTFVLTIAGGSGQSDVLATRFDPSKISISGGTLDSITPASTGSPAKLNTVTVVATVPRQPGNTVVLNVAPGMVTDVAGNRNDPASQTLTISATN